MGLVKFSYSCAGGRLFWALGQPTNSDRVSMRSVGFGLDSIVNGLDAYPADLRLLLFQTPDDTERVATFAGSNESAFFHRFYRTAVGRERADYFVVF